MNVKKIDFSEKCINLASKYGLFPKSQIDEGKQKKIGLAKERVK